MIANSTPASSPSRSEPYLQAPRIIIEPGPAYAAQTRAFQGISSLACGREGRLWAVWYGGPTPGEDQNNYVMLAVSHDRGRTWSREILVIQHEHELVRDFDPEIWLAPDGRIWLFWAQHAADNRKAGSLSGVWAITAREDHPEKTQWSEPRRLCDGVMMCKPLVLSTGEWALPVSFWHRREAASAAIVVSTDQGKSWSERGACDVPPDDRNHDEHMIVERRDGTLWMLVRTNYGIGESFSNDGGRSWSTLNPANLPHPRTRFFIRRLKSGNLLLVRHNPGPGKFANRENKGERSHLTAYLSQDDGHNWSAGLLLDERLGVSYPDGDQAEEGTIFITYDHDRRGAREIMLAEFSEEAMINPDAAAKPVRLRCLINQATLPPGQ